MKKLIIIIICFTAFIIYACKHELIITTTVPTNLVYVPTNSTIVNGTAGNSVVPTIDNGGSACTFIISGTAIAGISINTNTGVISWATSVGIGTYNITVTASNSVGSTATSYILIVNSALSGPSNLIYSPGSSTVVKGGSGNSAIPSINNGGSTVTYSLTGTIPTSISINSNTGVISWSSAVTTGIYTIAVTATNSLGKTTASYTLTVNNTSTVVAPSTFSYNPSNSSVAQGTSGTSSTPTINNGLGIITYSISGIVPGGVSINNTTGIINWNTTVASGVYNLTLTAANSAGNTTTNYALTVTAGSTAVCFSSDILPLYQTYCAQTSCHNSVTKAEGVVTDSYANIMNGIKANNSGSSKYFTVIGGSMPPNGKAQMTASQIALIKQWINEGATNSTCSTAICDTTQYTYTNGISVLFANNCNGCHSVAPGSGNVILSDYASAKAAGINLKVSFLNAINYTSATAAMNMPPGGQLSSCQITQITKWINNGCPQ
jgi:hypothetical protein